MFAKQITQLHRLQAHELADLGDMPVFFAQEALGDFQATLREVLIESLTGLLAKTPHEAGTRHINRFGHASNSEMLVEVRVDVG